MHPPPDLRDHIKSIAYFSIQFRLIQFRRSSAPTVGEADEINGAARLDRIAAIRTEVGTAVGAEIAEAEMRFLEAGPFQLKDIGRGQVKKIFPPAAGSRSEDVERQRSAEEGLPDILPHFIAGRPDAGSQPGPQRARVAAAALLEQAHRFLGDPLGRAPPAAMNGGYPPPVRVSQQERQTIGRFDHQEQKRPVGDCAVGPGRRRWGVWKEDNSV